VRERLVAEWWIFFLKNMFLESVAVEAANQAGEIHFGQSSTSAIARQREMDAIDSVRDPVASEAKHTSDQA